MTNDGAVMLSANGTLAHKAEKAVARFGGRQIRNYVGDGISGMRWRFHPALRRGQFNRYDAWAMLRDPAIQIGLLALMSPFPSVNFEVRANSRDGKIFIENAIHRFWTHDVPKVLLHQLPHGTCVAEVLYDRDQDSGLWKYAGLDDFHLDEVQALRRGRVLTGARINHSSALYTEPTLEPNERTGAMPNELRPPKLFWCGHRALCGDLFGQSVFEAAWDAWMEKVGAHGAIDIRKLWAFTCAFRGAIIVYPPGGQQGPNGQISNQDVAREIGQCYATGATMTMPYEPDEKTGKNMWEIHDPVSNGDIKQLIDYPDKLDEAIWSGMGVPPEAIRSLDSQGWGNAKGVPMLLLLNGVDLIVRELMTAFDVGPGGYTSRAEQSGGVLRPLCLENYGPKFRYEVRVFPLVPKAQPQGAGGPGGAPGAPPGAPPAPGGGAPPGAPPPIPGAGSAPLPGTGKPSAIGLSQADRGELHKHVVELSNELVCKILGRELPACLAAPVTLSATVDTAAVLEEVGKELAHRKEPPFPMPGYGQIFTDEGKVWYVGGDGDDDGWVDLVKKTIKKAYPGATEIICEAEAFPPKDKGWTQVYPRKAVALGTAALLGSAAFNAAKHPRGQPQNKGEFAKAPSHALKMPPAKDPASGAGSGMSPEAFAQLHQKITAPVDSARQRIYAKISTYLKTSQDKATEQLDKVPGVAKARAKLLKAKDGLEQRYGKTQSKLIIGAGVGLAWGVFAAGSAYGVPLWAPGSTFYGWVPFALLAEAYYQLSGKAKAAATALSAAESAEPAQLTHDQIMRLGYKFAKDFAASAKADLGDGVSLSAATLDKLPSFLRGPVQAAFEDTFGAYLEAGEAVAELELSDEQKRTVQAASATWAAAQTVKPLALSSAGNPSGSIPAASLCYLAYSAANDPMGALRTAQRAVGGGM